jgi:gamma-glutamylcyclotransferase (GGCT)/AIG2-like uncharacterized protein YtfP
MNRLFVYGTLRPGDANAHFLNTLDGSWTQARVRGRLYSNGIGPTLGYPALQLDDDGDWIKGMLLCSDQLETIWQRLDEFEGEGYVRSMTIVTLPNGQDLETYIYALDETYL